MRPSSILISGSLLLLVSLTPSLASAQAGAWVSIENEMLEPGQKAVLVVVPDEDLHALNIEVVRDDGKKQTFAAGRTVGGTRLTFEWKQAEGKHDYDVKVNMTTSDGWKSEMEEYITVIVAGPFDAAIPAEQVNLEERTFVVKSNRPVAAVQIEILDEDLETVGKETLHITDSVKGKPTTVQWSPTEGDKAIFRIWVRTYDSYDFWADNEIIPWSLEIPHEDVNFATNSYEVTEEESPKLDNAYKEIRKAIKKYGEFVQCKLFISGYTDTVGDGGSNMTLSLNRARSIAKYFQAAGFEFDIYYQGFGESALAVPTGDSVNELANRRAKYIIAAGYPAKSKDIPRSNWTRLQ